MRITSAMSASPTSSDTKDTSVASSNSPGANSRNRRRPGTRSSLRPLMASHSNCPSIKNGNSDAKCP
ncbi:MAG: hypothetical protein WCG79_07455, partial [Verrucomicrobiota bacterium]